MTHLGSRISALVDGQLSVAATERALAHVAACALCAEALAAARAARQALACAVDDVPPAPDFTARLLSLGATLGEPQGAACPVPPVRRDPFAPPGLTVPAVHGRRARALRGEVEQRRSGTRLAAGSLAGVGALAAMLFVMGEQPTVTPVGHPGTDLGLLGSAATPARVGQVTSAADATTVAAALRDDGWTFPAELPAGWSVADVRWTDDSTVEVDLVGPDGVLVVTEQAGRLDTNALAGADRVEIAGREAYVLSYAPWHAVWQCDDTVVQVVAGDDASSLVAAFPGGAYDDGVPARISRGWSTVTGAFAAP
ncbi:hypothetical protein [Cellulomonas gilvus]|uniref:Putative transmembrane anti-sigma factor n=1 Tax=Cellulomonas gilvus (strain ATCC 13127 / NRRL B-14078) TaxID=593907 RepID=F8A2N9_CELGA|nr:hypothetical protein [Cellulomonas gilvus]AEI13032.1 putative transmembrane anti-sigma factor [Cellulomonas gilvus ATCC 13127]